MKLTVGFAPAKQCSLALEPARPTPGYARVLRSTRSVELAPSVAACRQRLSLTHPSLPHPCPSKQRHQLPARQPHSLPQNTSSQQPHGLSAQQTLPKHQAQTRPLSDCISSKKQPAFSARQPPPNTRPSTQQPLPDCTSSEQPHELCSQQPPPITSPSSGPAASNPETHPSPHRSLFPNAFQLKRILGKSTRRRSKKLHSCTSKQRHERGGSAFAPLLSLRCRARLRKRVRI